jgi:2-dehydro-3-deoxyphosphogluconate aldolase/(4S)-4-hydroxy-2-oxoglutarate aldolase
MRDATATLERLTAAKVVPVLRFEDSAQARFAIDCLLDAGFATVEITLTTPHATTLITELRSRVPTSFMIGAGTVLDTRQAESCIAAGADFLVSPCVANGIARLAHDAGCAALLGAFTPSEVLAALEQGSDIVKLFPAATGGPSHLAALHAVFPDVTFCPTGGINAGNMHAYFEAGAKLVGVGNSIIDRQAMKDGDQARATELASRYLTQAGVAK